MIAQMMKSCSRKGENINNLILRGRVAGRVEIGLKVTVIRRVEG